MVIDGALVKKLRKEFVDFSVRVPHLRAARTGFHWPPGHSLNDDDQVCIENDLRHLVESLAEAYGIARRRAWYWLFDQLEGRLKPGNERLFVDVQVESLSGSSSTSFLVKRFCAATARLIDFLLDAGPLASPQWPAKDGGHQQHVRGLLPPPPLPLAPPERSAVICVPAAILDCEIDQFMPGSNVIRVRQYSSDPEAPDALAALAAASSQIEDRGLPSIGDHEPESRVGVVSEAPPPRCVSPDEERQRFRLERRKRRAIVVSWLNEFGLTSSGWASKAGCDPSVALGYLSGKSSPTMKSREALARVIGKQEADLPA